jgi:co-chaperonin GroES (HSP10)|uniref:Co-chaperonin GroES n=1 Tax=uncultured virus TaxID=340016 RepID=A0A221S3A2_9VIRU|nr:co-chaperonin GroES [uncultured virus]
MQAVAMDKAMLNDQWISADEAPDPTVLPRIPGYHILVRPVSVKKQTKGGILLPDSTVNDISILTTVGKVLAIGDTAYEDDRKFPKGPWCSVGDYVCYGKHTGQKFFYKGVRMLLMFDDQISMVINDPKELDPTFNLSN